MLRAIVSENPYDYTRLFKKHVSAYASTSLAPRFSDLSLRCSTRLEAPGTAIKIFGHIADTISEDESYKKNQSRE